MPFDRRMNGIREAFHECRHKGVLGSLSVKRKQSAGLEQISPRCNTTFHRTQPQAVKGVTILAVNRDRGGLGVCSGV